MSDSDEVEFNWESSRKSGINVDIVTPSKQDQYPEHADDIRQALRQSHCKGFSSFHQSLIVLGTDEPRSVVRHVHCTRSFN